MRAPIPVRYHRFQYTHPAREEPIWKSRVERWYQLDAFAYGLTQAYTIWKPKLSRQPALILLASPQASNETDLAFVRSGATATAALSPAKFVHTLPNIRCSPLCQVMEWAGPVLCVQNDPRTRIQALREAAALDETIKNKSVWVLGAFRLERLEPATYQAEAWVLGDPGDLEIVSSPHQDTLQTDLQLQEWLDSVGLAASPAFGLGAGLELKRAEK